MNIESDSLDPFNEYKQQTILIIDDEPSILDFIGRYLQTVGLTTITALTGQEGLRRAQYEQVDLILLDGVMPDIDGFEVCRRLKANEATKDIPVIFLTARAKTTDEVKGLQLGAVDYITKPVQLVSALARIRTHLTVRRLQRDLQEKNTRLQQEIIERKQAEEALKLHRDQLEELVAERTTELLRANEQLTAEIAERKEVEAQLRKSEKHFRQVANSISDHIYVGETSADGRYLSRYHTHDVESLTGYPHQNFIDDWTFWPSVVIHPDDRAMATQQAKRSEVGQDSEMEYRLLRADGRVIWVRDSTRVEIEGDVKVVYGVVSDITERKQAEEAQKHYAQELEQRVAERTRVLTTLYNVTTAVSEALDLPTALELSLAHVTDALQAPASAIYLFDEADKKFHLTAHRGPAADLKVLPEVCLANENANPLICHDLKTSPALIHIATLNEFDFCISASIKAGGRVLGALCIFDQNGQRFTESDVALLTSVTDRIGAAIENARLRQQAKQLAVMEERERLARELHDAVTQSLYSLTLFVNGAQDYAANKDLERVKAYLDDIAMTAHLALREMRLLLYELRPPALEEDGLAEALRHRLNAVERRVGIKTRIITDAMPNLTPPVEEAFHRIAQEALNNALKYAQAEQIAIHIYAEGEHTVMKIIDNGRGFDLDTAKNQAGMGLSNMRARVEKLGGVLTILTQPEKGTTIQVMLGSYHKPTARYSE